ncbi:MAG: tetratricopeptide repeat protein [Desulfatibacillaceae bacterium]|nr:tetratricopeptide repeat protein [Desulfatibacillaceae bacterium]
MILLSKHFTKPARVLIILFIALCCIAVFGQTINYGFLRFDDPLFVTENPIVQKGFSAGSIKAAFSTHAGYFIPAVWLSYMADYSLWGNNPAGFRATNIFLHALAAILLFLALDTLTKARWKSALVAILFAVHPLVAEPVVWISSRKDVLCGFFWMAGFWAWAHNATKPGAIKQVFMLAFFVLACLSKPVAVAFPLALFAVDYWAAHLGHSRPIGLCITEKLPMLAIAAIFALITLKTKGDFTAIQTGLDFCLKAGNALVSLCLYIKKLFWPVDLAIFYPHPGEELSPFAVALAAFLISAALVAAVGLRRTHPYILAGGIWFVAVTGPALGLVQTGAQAMADRFAYLALPGLLWIIVWGGEGLAQRLAAPKKAVALGAAILVAAAGTAGAMQAAVWQNRISLYSHAVNVTENNWFAHNRLAMALVEAGNYDEAWLHYSQSLEIRPDYAAAANNLALLYFETGKPVKAAEVLLDFINKNPHIKSASILNNLAMAHAQTGDIQGAAFWFEQAAQAAPTDKAVLHNLALAYRLLPNIEKSDNVYSAILLLDPQDATAKSYFQQKKPKILDE